jgi:hypothetical protein
MKKTKTLPNIPSYLGVFVDTRAVATLSVRLTAQNRSKIERLARIYETSLTEIVLWALSKLPHPASHTDSKATDNTEIGQR